jgi:hypothetical protein
VHAVRVSFSPAEDVLATRTASSLFGVSVEAEPVGSRECRWLSCIMILGWAFYMLALPFISATAVVTYFKRRKERIGEVDREERTSYKEVGATRTEDLSSAVSALIPSLFLLIWPFVLALSVIPNASNQAVAAFWTLALYFAPILVFMGGSCVVAYYDKSLTNIQVRARRLDTWSVANVVSVASLLFDGYQLCSVSFVKSLYPPDTGTVRITARSFCVVVELLVLRPFCRH